jgi:hypothetical protein
MERESVAEGGVERDLYTPSFVVHDIEGAGPPARHASSLRFTSAVTISQKQAVSLPELSSEGPRTKAQPMLGTAIPAPMIRPAAAESHIVLGFPKTMHHASLTPSAQLPIHVRIGRVEVRETAPPTSVPTGFRQPAPLGFDTYSRVRNYRI